LAESGSKRAPRDNYAGNNVAIVSIPSLEVQRPTDRSTTKGRRMDPEEDP